jgi:chromosome segregation ATPase
LIELILFVALGFLVAALLGLIVAPAIYRRVVKLTERRMRSTVPLNAAEIKASKDMERAAFAAESARISVELRKERELLTEEKVGSSRLSNTIVKMRSQNEQLRTHVDDLKLESGKLRSNLRVEEGKLEKTQATLKAAQENNLEKEKQITSLIDRANRLSTDVGALKIDLASKDTESENLRSSSDRD